MNQNRLYIFSICHLFRNHSIHSWSIGSDYVALSFHCRSTSDTVRPREIGDNWWMPLIALSYLINIKTGVLTHKEGIYYSCRRPIHSSQSGLSRYRRHVPPRLPRPPATPPSVLCHLPAAGGRTDAVQIRAQCTTRWIPQNLGFLLLSGMAAGNPPSLRLPTTAALYFSFESLFRDVGWKHVNIFQNEWNRNWMEKWTIKIWISFLRIG